MTGSALADATNSSPRIVGCTDPVQSHKRGVCANHLTEADFRAFAPGVSWYYNWHYETQDIPPSDVPMEFVPMAWGRDGDVDGLDSYLGSTSRKPRIVLAINEPNLKGQAFITPEKTADFYKRIKDVADRNQLTVCGPNMALGSATGDSITAMDPLQNKKVTYTFMVPFLQAFYSFLSGPSGGGTSVDGSASTDTSAGADPSTSTASTPAAQPTYPGTPLGVHSYQGLGELKWAVDSLHKQFNCPIWVTEYAEWKAGDVNEARDYLIQATDFLERTPYVQGYAWFKERANNNPKISLLQADPGKLSPLGEAYVAMPVHDSDLYYRIPGKLAAGKYVAIDQASIMANSHNDFLISGDAAGATVDYNIQVDNAGSYKLDLKALGSGKVDVLENDQVLGSADLTGSDVQELAITATLPAGTQTLRVRFANSGTILSSIDFETP